VLRTVEERWGFASSRVVPDVLGTPKSFQITRPVGEPLEEGMTLRRVDIDGLAGCRKARSCHARRQTFQLPAVPADGHPFRPGSYATWLKPRRVPRF